MDQWIEYFGNSERNKYLECRKLLKRFLNFSFNSAFVSMCFYRHTRTFFYAGILHSIRFDLRRNKTYTIEGLQTFMILLSHRATICEYFFYFLHTETCKSRFHSILCSEQLFLFLCLGPSSNNVLGKILFENITTTRLQVKEMSLISIIVLEFI